MKSDKGLKGLQESTWKYSSLNASFISYKKLNSFYATDQVNHFQTEWVCCVITSISPLSDDNSNHPSSLNFQTLKTVSCQQNLQIH